MDSKSSFMSRRVSKEDAIIQFLRPQLGNKLGVALDLLERTILEIETLTKLGAKLQPGANNGENFFVTPEELRKNLDEYPELEKFAVEGRALLSSLGYESRRKSSPLVAGGDGPAPVGKVVDIQPIQVQLPGSESLAGVTITPKQK